MQQQKFFLHKQSSSSRASKRRVAAAQEDEAASSSSQAAAAPPSSVVINKRGPFTWASCVATQPNINKAVGAAAATIQAQWAQQQQQQQQQQSGQEQQQQQEFQPDLAIVFASCNYGSQLQDVVRAVRRAAPSVKHIFGCSVSPQQQVLHLPHLTPVRSCICFDRLPPVLCCAVL